MRNSQDEGPGDGEANLVAAGVPQHVVMKLCGWETDDMFRRYAIVDERTLAEVVAKRYGKPAASGTPSNAPSDTLSSSTTSTAA